MLPERRSERNQDLPYQKEQCQCHHRQVMFTDFPDSDTTLNVDKNPQYVGTLLTQESDLLWNQDQKLYFIP